MLKFGLGDHVALMYSTQDEQWQKVIPYIKEGLLVKEKIVYVVDDNTAKEVKKAMLVWDKELFLNAFKREDVAILSSKETYHLSGEFGPEAMYILIAKR